MKRVRVVPWSSAPTYRGMSEPDQRVEAGADDAADDRRDDGNPRVAPVGRPLAGNRKNRVRDTRPEIARGIDRVAGGSAQRQADAEHEHADQQRLQSAAEH